MTTRNFCLLFFAGLLPCCLSAQDNAADPEPHVERIMPKISLITTGLAGEFGIGKTVTFFTHAGIGLGFSASTTTNGPSGGYFVTYPFLIGEIRKYYSLEKRMNKGKIWRGNSGAYLGGFLGYNFDALSEKASGDVFFYEPFQPSFSIGPVWGFQFTEIRSSNFNFSISVGPGVNIRQDGEARFTGVSHLNLGFVFGKYPQD